jgi:hypothetical protein
MVGAGRFERPTPCAQGRCATRLRYAPTIVALLILKHFLIRRMPRKAQTSDFANVVRRGGPSRCEIATFA